MIDVGRQHHDAVVPCIPHDLRGRVEAHRLRVEQRGSERRRVMALQPARDIDQVREARGVALGKAVFAEALDLVEAAFGELGIVAALDHSADHPLFQFVHRPS
jgi:hypothetical protein